MGGLGNTAEKAGSAHRPRKLAGPCNHRVLGRLVVSVDPGKGDMAAILHAAEPGLLRLALLLTGDREAAADLTQETFARAWAARRRVVGVDQPRAYLRTIMVNLARREGRTRKHQESLELAADHAAPGDHALEVVTKEVMSRALKALPTGQRTAVALRFYEQLSEKETAHLMGCSVGNVKSQTSRGVAALRRSLGVPEEQTS